MAQHVCNATRARAGHRSFLAGLLGATCLTLPGVALAQTSTAPAAAAQAQPAETAPPSPAEPSKTAPVADTSAQVTAAPEPGSSMGDVVVTARRRSEIAEKVPISIVAVTAAQLEDAGVKDPNDLSKVAPGLAVQDTAANRGTTTFAIRGQGETYGSAAPGVIPYFAEVPNFSTQIFDLQNVQVLKGPQGTLFGRNTTGGAILFSPIMPSDKWNGYIDTRFGNFDNADLEAALGGPILGDVLTFRVAIQSLLRDGFTTYERDGSKLDNVDRKTGRIMVTFRPFEGFENTTTYQAQRIHEHGSGAILDGISTDPTINVNAAAYATQLQQQLALQKSLGIRTALGDDPTHFFVDDSTGIINNTRWRINDLLTFKNIFSYSRTNTGQSYDLDATNLPLLSVDNPADNLNHTLTEEFQTQLHLGSVDATVGYFYEHDYHPYQEGYDIQEPSLGLGPLALFGPTASIGDYGSANDDSNAVYGQVDWRATQALTLSAGIRNTQDNIENGVTNTDYFTPAPLAPLFGPIIPLVQAPRLTTQFNAITWNVAADYALTRDLNLYGHVSKGYKEGGFNGTALLAQDRSFQPEYVTDYEIGAKGRGHIGGMQTRFDVDAFYDDYTNIQRFENIVEMGVPQTITKNAAAGYIAGIETQLTLVASKYFEVSGGYTYLYARYTKWNDPVNGNLADQKFPETPTHQLSVTPLVTIPIPPSAGGLTAQATLYYQSSIATDPFNVPNGSPAVDLDALGANLAKGYDRVDFRVDWRHVYSSPFSISFYALNAFNTKYIVGTNNQLNAATGTVSALYGAPAFYGVELRYEFGRQ